MRSHCLDGLSCDYRLTLVLARPVLIYGDCDITEPIGFSVLAVGSKGDTGKIDTVYGDQEDQGRE